MKLLFSVLPSYGHLYPLIPLALAARDAGNEVFFATAEECHRSLKAFGLQAIRAGIDFGGAYAEAARSIQARELTERDAATQQARMFGSAFPRAFVADLVPLIRELRPDLVVYGALHAGGFFASKLTGTPAVCHGCGRAPAGAELARHPLLSMMWEELLPLARRLGVEVSESFSPGYGDPYLDVCPPALRHPLFAARANHRPLRLVPINEPCAFPEWVLTRRSERPVVYVTMGSVFNEPRMLREIIDGVSLHEVDVLVATGRMPIEALGALPDNVHAERWVPQAELLSAFDLIVHHGGDGTLFAALHAGLPQLIVPQVIGQDLVAEAVAAAGAAECLANDELSVECVSGRVARLLSTSYREAASTLAREIATLPAPADVLPDLIKIAGGRAPSASRSS
jgi:UDP:flavonoid glycosyltransferase YjiC (YdhE family)